MSISWFMVTKIINRVGIDCTVNLNRVFRTFQTLFEKTIL